MKREKLNLDEIKKRIGNQKLIIFGAGILGSIFYKKVFADYDIAYVVDNNLEPGYSLYGKTIVNFEYFIKNYNNEVIIVTTLNYCDEISEQLELHQFEYEKNYLIWNGHDNSENVSANFADENTKRFISKNKELWAEKKKCDKRGQIIIPYRRSSEIVYAPWSYAANYLADKYDAEILCAGGVESAFDDDLLELYYSFNVSKIIDERPIGEVKRETEQIFEEIWRGIKSKEDIWNIEIYGENYGKDIVRDYLRMEFPIIYINDINLKKQMKRMIGYIVFWNKYIKEKHGEIKAIILWDGTFYREAIIRKLAVLYGIPVYSVIYSDMWKGEYEEKFNYEFYKKYFHMLSKKEQEEGIEWAKHRLEEHLQGNVKDYDIVESVYKSEKQQNVLENSEKIKIMICPHYTGDDPFSQGDMLFMGPGDWLEHLGELSEKTEYDWYFKPHPVETEFGDNYIKAYLKRYPKIKLLPKYVSPFQLKDEGMKYALTIHGSIGYEYPMIGINVINAGNNPHIAFGFDVNPKSIEEYDNILYNLKNMTKKVDVNEIYEFYAIHFGYYQQRKFMINKIFYKDQRLQEIRGFKYSKTRRNTELFRYWIEEINEERHKELQKLTERLFQQIDNYKDTVFHKKKLE